MNFKKKYLVLFLGFICFACDNSEHSTIQPQIIPAPDSLNITEGSFYLSSDTDLVYDAEFKPVVAYWDAIASPVFGPNTGKSNTIRFVLDENFTNSEAYALTINSKEIVIKSSSAKSAFYAVQSLIQLLPPEFMTGSLVSKGINIQNLKIEDAPQFSYRGMHLDVARHMYPVEFIKKYIDALAMLKLNTFHWHLTEDQGWRIEIKKYPKLQEVAAYRDETLVGHYSDQPHQFDGKRYGGFYTQEEVKEVVAYAKERFITVIPEIEMPGHSQAAIAAYPNLGCSGEQVNVATKWGVFENIYCTKEYTFKFLEDVLDEVVALFPNEYIHIGGDEAPKTKWKSCSYCQQKIKDEGLKDEHELQNYFITRMEKYLNSKGRQIIGWDEILEGGLAPNATVMSWRGMEGAVEAAKQKHDVVMTPTSHCYFDYYQSEDENEPLAFGGFLPLEKVYSFNPIPEELTEAEAQYIIGVQGNVWTEYMPTSEQVEYMVFPRILAMSEVAWSKPDAKDFEDFVKRVEVFNKRLDVLGLNYANHLYQVEGELISENGMPYFEFTTLTDNKTIRYTTDGTDPRKTSTIYTSKIPVTKSSILKVAVFDDEKRLGEIFIQDINFHKAVGKTITIDKEPSKAYMGSGSQGLVNGINGNNKRFGDKEWLGFSGEDIEVTIDLGEPTEVSSISTRFHNGNGQWIYAPKNIYLEFILDDGSIVTDKVSLESQPKNIITEFNYDFLAPKELNVKVKQITLNIPNYGTIADGKQGAGNRAWTFIDEIIVN